jgi:hypothetical protein
MLPLRRPRRSRWRRYALSHNRRRVAGHYFGPIDPVRAAAGRAFVGVTSLPFYGLFGTPEAAFHHLPRHTAKMIAFRGCPRSELVVIKHKLEEIRAFVRGGCRG